MNKSQYYIPKNIKNDNNCGPHVVIESLKFIGQVLLLTNELLILYLIPTDYWLVNRYADTVIFVIGHIFNFIYYKIKCREFNLMTQTILEVTNVIISLSILFLTFQLAPNISISLYNNQQETGIVILLLFVQFTLMSSIYTQSAQLCLGMLSVISRCYVNYLRQKNKSKPNTPLIQDNITSNSLLDLANQLDTESQRSF